MRYTTLMTGFALAVFMASAQAATPQPEGDAAKKLPAGDNVQVQTRAKVRKTAPRVHRPRHKHGSTAKTESLKN
jgi:hypothetical protein